MEIENVNDLKVDLDTTELEEAPIPEKEETFIPEVKTEIPEPEPEVETKVECPHCLADKGKSRKYKSNETLERHIKRYHKEVKIENSEASDPEKSEEVKNIKKERLEVIKELKERQIEYDASQPVDVLKQVLKEGDHQQLRSANLSLLKDSSDKLFAGFISLIHKTEEFIPFAIVNGMRINFRGTHKKAIDKKEILEPALLDMAADMPVVQKLVEIPPWQKVLGITAVCAGEAFLENNAKTIEDNEEKKN